MKKLKPPRYLRKKTPVIEEFLAIHRRRVPRAKEYDQRWDCMGTDVIIGRVALRRNVNRGSWKCLVRLGQRLKISQKM